MCRKTKITKLELIRAVSKMISIFERGAMLPYYERFYEVRLHTEGTTIKLVEYTNSGGRPTGHTAAESAKSYIINEITYSLYQLIGGDRE